MSHANPLETPAAGPAARHLWMLVLAVVIGGLLGPAVLGQLAPGLYEQWFLGGSRERAALEAWERSGESRLRRLGATGTDSEGAQAALERMLASGRELEVALVLARLEQRHRHLAHMNALVLALLAIMVFEAMTGRAGDRLSEALVTLRYALVGAWIVWLLIRPDVLEHLSFAFLAILLAAGLAASHLLSRRKGGSSGRRRRSLR